MKSFYMRRPFRPDESFITRRQVVILPLCLGPETRHFDVCKHEQKWLRRTIRCFSGVFDYFLVSNTS